MAKKKAPAAKARKQAASPRSRGLHTSPIPKIEARLAEAPDRQDLRLQLLNLYYEAGLSQEFVREAGRYREIERKRLENREWNEVVRMGRSLEPFSALFASDKLVLEAWDILGAPPDLPTRKARRFGDDDEAREPLAKLAAEYRNLRRDREARLALERFPDGVVGRFSPLHEAKRLAGTLGGARLFVKREDLAPPESYLILHIFGQAHLARRLGYKRLVSGSSNAARGALTAAAAAHFGLACTVFLDRSEARRQGVGVVRLRLLGARIREVDVEALPGRDIRQAGLSEWLRKPREHFMVLELGAGPDPYPLIAQDLTGAIGREARQQFLDAAGWMPDVVVARGSGRADAIALFPPFLEEPGVRLVCAEPEGGLSGTESDADPYNRYRQPLETELRTRADAILESHGFPRVEREHRDLKKSGQIEYVTVDADAAKRAITECGRLEGIIPGLETAYPLAWAMEAAARGTAECGVLVLFAQRGDRDILDIARLLGTTD